MIGNMGLPLSAGRGKPAGGPDKSTALPDWPASAGQVAVIASAMVAARRRIPLPLDLVRPDISP
jgi:hypothetical protein